jgi:hypothetical protein
MRDSSQTDDVQTVSGRSQLMFAAIIFRISICIIMVFVLMIGSGCTSFGPTKLVGSHEGYNDAVQLTVTREVLKNIVRKRYADPMQFITVSAINAQFSVSAGANAGVSGNGSDRATGSVGGTVGYSESPTITYVPQLDAGLNKSLDSPIELREAVSYIFNWGQFQPYEVGLVVGAINDAPDRGGSAGARYREQVDALVRLFERGATLKYFREFYPRHEPIPMSQVGGLAYTLAAQAGFYFYDAGEGKVHIASKHLGIGLVVHGPHEGDTAADLHTLGLTPGESFYPIRAPGEAEPKQYGLQPNTIWFAPRSVEGMIELAAMGVEIPSAHARSGIAPPQGPAANSGVEIPIRIRYSGQQPDSIYRIQHRGYWFYIDDTDTISKKLFSLLVDTYTSRIGSKVSSDEAPQIVLPIGGG